MNADGPSAAFGRSQNQLTQRHQGTKNGWTGMSSGLCGFVALCEIMYCVAWIYIIVVELSGRNLHLLRVCSTDSQRTNLRQSAKSADPFPMVRADGRAGVSSSRCPLWLNLVCSRIWCISRFQSGGLSPVLDSRLRGNDTVVHRPLRCLRALGGLCGRTSPFRRVPVSRGSQAVARTGFPPPRE